MNQPARRQRKALAKGVGFALVGDFFLGDFGVGDVFFGFEIVELLCRDGEGWVVRRLEQDSSHVGVEGMR